MSNVLNNLTKTKWKGEFNEVAELETLKRWCQGH